MEDRAHAPTRTSIIQTLHEVMEDRALALSHHQLKPASESLVVRFREDTLRQEIVEFRHG